MPTSGGHGPKTAILYARVSTDEQARSGYSLAQQIEALRAYCEREGYEVTEEVVDPGQSGASLERPGMDRVRDLVASGGVSVVLAQDRDRFAREPAYLYLLRREFEEHGTRLRSLNDRGDGSPEGELTDGILDQLAKFERAKIAERTRRGTLRRAREGKIIPGRLPDYGFAYNAEKSNYVVVEDEMAVVRRIFRMIGVEGMTIHAVKVRLEAEGVRSPTGLERWVKQFIRKTILDDVYKPHTYSEVAAEVTPEVASRLDPGRTYGIWWFNRRRYTYRHVGEDGPDGRTYRRSSKVEARPRSEWVAIPTPDAGVPREWVEAARRAIKDNRRVSNAGFRLWQLSGGVCYCDSCGWAMGARTVRRKATSPGRTDRRHFYYLCTNVHNDRGCDHRKNYRAAELEEEVWEFVSGLLKNPERLRRGLDRMIERKRQEARGNPEKEAKVWAEKLAEVERMRSGYQEQAARGYMSLDELGERLAGLEEQRRSATRELTAIRRRAQELAGLEADRDTLLRHYASLVPEALEKLTPEERCRVYRMMNLKIHKINGGTFRANWTWEIEGEVPRPETATTRYSYQGNTRLCFSAVPSEGERVEVERVVVG